MALKTYRLKMAANTIDPLFISRMQGGAVEAVVFGDATVEVAGSKLVFAVSAEPWLPVHLSGSGLVRT